MAERTTIALLSQPNAGKSTLFNGLTGSRQHVGNWPGKTVEKKEGHFSHNGNDYAIIDLPGTYSLSANSNEEIVTRDYIASGNADLVCILADASQLERSLYMLSDFAGIGMPVLLILNMMDVASEQGKQIDCAAISAKLDVPVVGMSAADLSHYDEFYRGLEEALKHPKTLNLKELEAMYEAMPESCYKSLVEQLPSNGIDAYSPMWLAVKLMEDDSVIKGKVSEVVGSEQWKSIETTLSKITKGNLLTGNCKFRWIDTLLKGSIKTEKDSGQIQSKFDRIATSRRWGKPLAIGIILVGLVVSLVIALPLIKIMDVVVSTIQGGVSSGLASIGVPVFIDALLCDAILGATKFALQMLCFVFGVSFVFGFIEEIGYMARISYVFDGTMSKLGLQGKAIMPFLVSFGCNIGGSSGTRVLDSWGQRVTAIATSWVVPCSATWGVIGLMCGTFFGAGAVLVIIALFLVALLHIFITSKIFGRKLLQENDRCGMIMELPPYHKPKWKNLFRFVGKRLGDVFKRAMKIIIVVAVFFWLLSYTPDGNIENSVIYKIGVAIEPITMFFGLKWQLFIAFLSSALGKEASLGVLAALFDLGSGMGNSGIWGAMFSSEVADSAALGGTLLSMVSKPEALAYIFAFFFNVPCIAAMGGAFQEIHSWKWTIKIILYYIVVALLMSTIAYHVGLLIF